jgi:hypothetical protein
MTLINGDAEESSFDEMGTQLQLLLHNHLDGTLRIPAGVQVVGWWVGMYSLTGFYHEGQERD